MSNQCSFFSECFPLIQCSLYSKLLPYAHSFSCTEKFATISSQRTKKKKSFVDRTRIHCTAGNGGKGCISRSSFLSRQCHKRRLDGGHGGNGGSVILMTDENERGLNFTFHNYRAENGGNGLSRKRHGRNGENTILKVPCGVVVKSISHCRHDKYEYNLNNCRNHRYVPSSTVNIPSWGSMSHDDYTSKSLSQNIMRNVGYQKTISVDLDALGAHVLIATGGKGGIGSCVHTNNRYQIKKTFESIQKKSQGNLGESTILQLELKLIGDIGLIGFPNSGKSSLLAALSHATPKIASYPFTTLSPNIGCIEYRDGFKVLMVDVPGLIDGASIGRGRGHSFLKHLLRTKALLYIVDIAMVDGRDPVEDLRILVKEIQSYQNGVMLGRPSFLVGNKVDLIDNMFEREKRLNGLLIRAHEMGVVSHKMVIGTSAGVTGEGLEILSQVIRDYCHGQDSVCL